MLYSKMDTIFYKETLILILSSAILTIEILYVQVFLSATSNSLFSL